MNSIIATCWRIMALLIALAQVSFADNQTSDTSPILSEASLPFRVNIETVGLQLPIGLHSGAVGTYKGYWLFIGGRTNGLHGFADVGAFPFIAQNTTIYAVDLANQIIYSRDLHDVTSGLTEEQIETLSVTSPEHIQENDTLFMVGGYGINNRIGSFDTKPVLTAISLPGLLTWVVNRQGSVVEHIRQISDPTFQIAGGRLLKMGSVMSLIFGQNFPAEFTRDSNGIYSEQVRQFSVQQDSANFSVNIYAPIPQTSNPNFRRRDLNVLPAIFEGTHALEYGWVALGGVFTETNGVWTVPVVTRAGGNPTMADPNDSTTFKQGMNEYEAAAVSLYSKKNKEMYNIIFGGITYEYYADDVLVTDPMIPFNSQVVTIKMDKNERFSLHLMSGQYPTIPATGSIGYLQFGAAAYFIPTNILSYANRTLSFDSIRKPTVIGYIVGGIASTAYNAIDPFTETSASRYIFKVTLTPTATR